MYVYTHTRTHARTHTHDCVCRQSRPDWSGRPAAGPARPRRKRKRTHTHTHTQKNTHAHTYTREREYTRKHERERKKGKITTRENKTSQKQRGETRGNERNRNRTHRKHFKMKARFPFHVKSRLRDICFIFASSWWSFCCLLSSLDAEEGGAQYRPKRDPHEKHTSTTRASLPTMHDDASPII